MPIDRRALCKFIARNPWVAFVRPPCVKPSSVVAPPVVVDCSNYEIRFFKDEDLEDPVNIAEGIDYPEETIYAVVFNKSSQEYVNDVTWDSVFSGDLKLALASIRGPGLDDTIWTSTNSGGTWTPSEQDDVVGKLWRDITMSADGTKLAAVEATNMGNGTIWTSIDSGGTWTPSKQVDMGVKSWSNITMSADGTKLAAIAAAAGGTIWTSTNSGGTWTQSKQDDVVGKPWTDITMSADGTKLAVVEANARRNGTIWTSTNSGDTWTPSEQADVVGKLWNNITMSADGTKLAAVEFFGTIWTSIDSGGTWTPYKQAGVDTLLLRRITAVTMSADGTKLAAVAFFNTIWTSTNSGGTWTPSEQDDVVGKPWRDITMSADGTKLAAVEDDENGTIWTSIDSGGTWTPSEQDDVVGKPWRAIASSSGVWGQEILAGSDGNTKAFKLGGVGQLGTAALTAIVSNCTLEEKIEFSRCGTALAAHQAVIRTQAGLETIDPEQVPFPPPNLLNAPVDAFTDAAVQVSAAITTKEILAMISGGSPITNVTMQIVYLAELARAQTQAELNDVDAISKWAEAKGHGTFGTSEGNLQIMTALFTECVQQYTGNALVLGTSPFPPLGGYVISPQSINAVLGITTYKGPDTTKVPYNDYIGPRVYDDAALQDLMDFFIKGKEGGGLNFKQYGHGSTRYSITYANPDDPELSYRSLITSDSALTPTDLGSHTQYVLSVAFNHNGSVLASGSYDDTIKLWRMSDNTEIATLTGHSHNVISVAFNHDGSVLASGSYDNTIKLWRMSDNTVITTLTGHSHNVISVAFNHDGSVLASGSYDNTIKLWRMSDNTVITALTGHSHYVWSVAFNHDGSVLASGSYDDTIKLWRMSDNTLITTLTGHSHNVYSVAFNHDGSVLASGSSDTTIKLWRMSDNTEIATLTGHAYSVYSVAFNHDGSVLASGSGDDTIQLWRMSDNTLITTLTGHGSWVSSVAFNHDGSVLASAGTQDEDGPVELWRMGESQELVKLRDTKLYLPIYEGVLGTFPLTIGDIDYLTIDSKNETEDPDDTNIFLNVYFERLTGDTSDPRLDYYLGQGGLVSVNLQNPDEGSDQSGMQVTTPAHAKNLYEKVKAQKITRIFISTSTTATDGAGTAKAPPKLDITLFNASLKVNECDKPFNIAFTKDVGPVITSGRTSTVETSELTLYETTVAGGHAPYSYKVSPDEFTIGTDGVVTVSKPLPVGEQTLMVEVTDLNGEMATKDVALDVYQKLDKDDAAVYAVAISGDTIVVGAYGANETGSAYVFERSDDGTWSQTKKLVADDAEKSDYFGFAVAISGDTIVVGAYGNNNDVKPDSGSAYVFERSDGTWSQTKKLVATDAAVLDYFGNSVAIIANTIVVGAYFDNNDGKNNSGSAYVFERSDDGIWSQTKKLVADDAEKSDYFGRGVAISGDTIVVGAYRDNNDGISNSGSAYVFVRSDDTWSQTKKLVADDAEKSDYFGNAVAISGDTIVVGAYRDNNDVKPDSGSAYVFERSDGTWSQTKKLVADDAADYDSFGNSVAIIANTIVVGAYFDNNDGKNNSGSAYVFVRSDDTWSQTKKLVADDAERESYFGNAVAISGDTIVVGSTQRSSGSAYVYGIKYD